MKDNQMQIFENKEFGKVRVIEIGVIHTKVTYEKG